MANILYPKGKEHLGNADIDLVSGIINAVLVDIADYTYAPTDEALDDIPASSRVSTATLSNTSFTNGIFDADDSLFTAVTGDVSEAIILYLNSGVEETSYLIAYLDTATGLPITPDGGDITIQWSNGSSKIFSL